MPPQLKTNKQIKQRKFHRQQPANFVKIATFFESRQIHTVEQVR